MNNIFWIKRGNKITAVKPAKILYIKGNKYGCCIYFYPSNKSSTRKTIISSGTLIYFENILKIYGFIRCHRNYLVNPLLIEEYCIEKSSICIGRQIVPVSKRKKSILLRFVFEDKLTKNHHAICLKTAF